MELINLSKQEFSKNQYERVIDTSFTQLVSSSIAPTASQLMSVGEFFNTYQELFFTIPKFGEYNSHEYIVKTSGEYIGSTTSDESIEALIEEITQLRQENLELNQQLIESKTANLNING